MQLIDWIKSIPNRILMNALFVGGNEMVDGLKQLPDDMMAELDFVVRGGIVPPQLEPSLACPVCWLGDGCDCVCIEGDERGEMSLCMTRYCCVKMVGQRKEEKSKLRQLIYG